MVFEKLNSLKKNKEINYTKKYSKLVIIGEDIYSFLMGKKLSELDGLDDFLIITSKKVQVEDLDFHGPGELRSVESFDLLNTIYSEIEMEPIKHESVYFKEQKLKSFTGRAKAEKLLWEEEYYTKTGIKFDTDLISNRLSNIELLNRFSDKVIHSYGIDSISKEVSSDLINPVNWSIKTNDNILIETQYIIWCKNPSDFLDFLQDKEKTPGVVKALNMDLPYSLFINYYFKKSIIKLKDTLFIPLSYTHDHGHFIGEFFEKDDKTVGKFIHYIDSENSTEEEIAKRIKYLKKTLEKIFPNYENPVSEYIYLRPYSFTSNLDDKDFHLVEDNFRNMFFVGGNAFIKKEFYTSNDYMNSGNKLSHITRGLISIKQVEEFLT